MNWDAVDETYEENMISDSAQGHAWELQFDVNNTCRYLWRQDNSISVTTDDTGFN